MKSNPFKLVIGITEIVIKKVFESVPFFIGIITWEYLNYLNTILNDYFPNTCSFTDFRFFKRKLKIGKFLNAICTIFIPLTDFY